MRYFIFIFPILLFSCAEEAKKNNVDSIPNILQVTSTPSTNRASFGTNGYSIELPVSFKIDSTISEKSSVYYFQPIDTNSFHGEAGIYIGKRPQMQDPNGNFYKREFSSVWMGQTVKWIEYKMNPNTQRETFVGLNDSTKIHCWCYSDRINDLEKLFDIIQTIYRSSLSVSSSDLGHTGYSIKLDPIYELVAENDSTFEINRKNRPLNNDICTMKIEVRKRPKPKPVLGHTKENLSTFSDSIAGGAAYFEKYNAHQGLELEGNLTVSGLHFRVECMIRSEKDEDEEMILKEMLSMFNSISKD